MPLCRRGMPRINPLPSDMDRVREENINEHAKAQASAAGFSSVVAPLAAQPIAYLNLAEVVAALERVIPTLTALAEKGIVDYYKDLKNMGYKVFTGLVKVELAWSWL